MSRVGKIVGIIFVVSVSIGIATLLLAILLRMAGNPLYALLDTISLYSLMCAAVITAIIVPLAMREIIRSCKGEQVGCR